MPSGTYQKVTSIEMLPELNDLETNNGYDSQRQQGTEEYQPTEVERAAHRKIRSFTDPTKLDPASGMNPQSITHNQVPGQHYGQYPRQHSGHYQPENFTHQHRGAGNHHQLEGGSDHRNNIHIDPRSNHQESFHSPEYYEYNEEYMDPYREMFRESYTHSHDNLNCLAIADHIASCPICSKFYNNDKTIYIIAIAVLLIVCLILTKKVLE